MDLANVSSDLSLIKEGYIAVFKDMLSSGLPLYCPEVKNGKIQKPANVTLNCLDDILEDEVKDFDNNYISSFTNSVSFGWAYVIFLMKTAMCYVEVCSSGGQVKKFVASSNLRLLQSYGDVSHFNGSHIAVGKDFINYIKVNKKKLTVSRTPLYANNGTIRVVPIAILQLAGDIIKQQLESKLWSFKYFKDNGSERSMVATVNKEILMGVYDETFVDNAINGSSFDAQTLSERGYVRVPEVGASKYDSGVRALNLTKIFEMKPISIDEVDKRFIDIDFSVVVPCFKEKIDKVNDINMLSLVCKQLSIPYDSTITSVAVLKDVISQWVDLSVAYGSTQFLRSLHLYMLENPVIFMGYTGKRLEFSSYNFNMGVGEEYEVSNSEFEW